MSVVTKDQLRALAIQIRDETKFRTNTANRVGTMLLAGIDSMAGGAIDITSNGALSGSGGGTPQAVINTAALQASVIAASAAGGGIVVIPPGDWYFQHGLLDINVVCQLDGLSKVVIAGSGVGATRLHLVNNADASFFNLTGGSSYITIRDMEMDGNRANQTPSIVHGVRTDAFSGLWLDNLYIHDISHYGIGVEGFVQQYMFFTNLKIENTGGDGFDQKNKADVNVYQHASNISVVNFGLSSGTQAGWDCRGAWQMTNYVCHFSNTDGSGIRMRNGETNTVAGGGFGGHRSHFSNIEVYGPGAASSASGIECVARDVVVHGGYIRDCLFGVSLAYDTPTGFGSNRSKFKAITTEACGTAGFITSVNADNNDFEDCTVNGGTYGFRIRSANCRLVSPRTLGTTTAAISIDTTGTFCEIVAPKLVASGSPGVPVTGLDITASDCSVVGGDIVGHVTNCSVSAARFTATGTKFRNATTDNVLIAVGGDDAKFIGCSSTGAASEGYQSRAARLQVIGGQSTGNGGLGLQTEASASDTQFLDVYMSGNTADFDDNGSNTTVRRSGPVAKTFNEAVSASATSVNIDVPILSSTTVTFLVEVNMEDSASARCTLRSKVQAYRSGSGAAVVSAGTSEFTTGTGLTLNLSPSGNNLRVSATKSAGTNCRLDTRIWEISRGKTVEFS